MLVGQEGVRLINQKMQNIVIINNSRTVWPTNILMIFLSSLDNLRPGAYIIFQF